MQAAGPHRSFRFKWFSSSDFSSGVYKIMQIANASPWDSRAQAFSGLKFQALNQAGKTGFGYRPGSLSFSASATYTAGDSVKFRGNTFSAPTSIPADMTQEQTRQAPGIPASRKFRFALNEPIHAPKVQAHLKTFPQFGPPPLNPAFHAERRETLMYMLPKNTTLIVPGASLKRRNGDVDYPFRQESNFYYLTGFDEPDSLAILSNVPGEPKFTLIVPPRDPAKETWTGKRSGVAGATQIYQADQAYENTHLDAILKERIRNSQHLRVLPAVANEEMNRKIYQAMLRHSPWGPQFKLLSDATRRAFSLKTQTQMNEATEAINKMRLVKTPYEIALLQRACTISAMGHVNAMRNLKLTREEADQRNHPHAQGRNEGEIQAQVEYDFRRHGAVRQGYDTIAGGGANACVLHYNTNRQFAKPGHLELVDAGAEYGYYTADITRTWPISGKYTPEQKAIYNLVLKAQEKGIQMTKPGVTMGQIHQECAKIINQGLMELGILPKDAKPNAYQPYFMHGTSHMLGMDVHDVPSPGQSINGQPLPPTAMRDNPLEPGNVFTVEPGIYIDPEVGRRNAVDPKWWGIGVRIEDDILVTDNGHLNLSAQVPRKAEEIEALMNQV